MSHSALGSNLSLYNCAWPYKNHNVSMPWKLPYLLCRAEAFIALRDTFRHRNFVTSFLGSKRKNASFSTSDTPFSIISSVHNSHGSVINEVLICGANSPTLRRMAQRAALYIAWGKFARVANFQCFHTKPCEQSGE